MTRAAAIALALLCLAAAPVAGQDSTGARPPAAAPRVGPLRPRPQTQARRPTSVRPTGRAQARNMARNTAVRVQSPAAVRGDPPPPGFDFRPAVEPKSVTVGDRFVSGAAISVPAGTGVEIEVPKDSADRWRVVGRAEVTPRDSARTRYLVVVPMVAWIPGLPDTARARLRLTGPDGRRLSIPIALRLPTVRAVLPDDSSKWRVRPPHDVWGPSKDWRGMALAALLALLLLGLIAWLVARFVRRRRRKLGPLTARQRALEMLERARTSGFIEAGNWKAFYTLVSEALRGYVAAIDARWSTDLTTTELLETMRAGGVAATGADALERLLRVADLSKFARHGRDPDAARRDLDDARGWIETFAAPAPEPVEPDAAGSIHEPVGAA